MSGIQKECVQYCSLDLEVRAGTEEGIKERRESEMRETRLLSLCD